MILEDKRLPYTRVLYTSYYYFLNTNFILMIKLFLLKILHLFSFENNNTVYTK